ncbi:MAG: HlyD family efflux transporter periplasmic adaptor subunit [Candidatus Omnitrophica bacterium]|nr:HlyD family efflux transporter periplasmic adaptor subunit [Candidatus Omnitrophota bacterium]
MINQIKNSNIRIKVYGLLFIAAVALVLWKQHDVIARRNQVVISMTREWNVNGKPVVLQRMVRAMVPEYTKITVQPAAARTATGFVPRNTLEKLAAGNDAYIDTEKGRVSGTITAIGDTVDVNTGMYPVEITFSSDLDTAMPALIVSVRSAVFKNAIVVPNEIIDDENGVLSVWKVADNKAVKAGVTIASRNGYGAIINSGIEEGDLVVFGGQGLLRPGDPVRIIAPDNPADAAVSGGEKS